MKKLLILSFLLLAVAFTGCKKDSPLDREKFIGEWSGTQTMNAKGNGITIDNSTSATTCSIIAGTTENEIFLDKNTSDELTALVTGSNFKINDTKKYMKLTDGTIVEMSVSGSGIVAANGTLTLSIVMSGIYKNVAVVFNITQSLNKN